MSEKPTAGGLQPRIDARALTLPCSGCVPENRRRMVIHGWRTPTPEARVSYKARRVKN